ncbi:hypothetical protein FALBO_2338 [Fusarium albosuccineum]|uniref:Azaphilone pigments biosynthesis cluster protein L N-terminal domain-containing protein n=1 Tax=Fusarium albosuccineum TaxID=1237068 RepID=A0A8H4LJW4_9HYPO|nr:hypothetical protein FALBO_2338 [Fusarium albosuccineum]
MDPLSIAAGAAGLAASCATIVKTLYTWIDDTVDVDENVSNLFEEVKILSRVLESISNASVQVPQVVVAEIDPGNGLWETIRATLDDIKKTFDKLNQLLAELEKSSFFSRGFFRKPTKQIRFSLRSKDITTYKDRIKSYNTAMTSALQMINVCLLIHSNSSQDSVFKVLSGLKSQVRRVEFALQTTSSSSPNLAGGREEDDRISRNLRQFVQVAESFHSSASTIVRDGARSTVWGGSIMGDPLTEVQTSRIERWIPPPVSEEPYGYNAGESSTNAGFQSDSDTEIELAQRIEELAVKNEADGDHAKAEQFYRSAIDRSEASYRSTNDITAMRVRLAYACMRQRKWAEGEEVLAPIAFERKTHDIPVYHGMHALAIFYLAHSKLEAAERYCKRALWGKRKVLGKDHPSCWDTLALLVSICIARNKTVEAEAHRSFIPPSLLVAVDTDALTYLNRSVGNLIPSTNSSDMSSSIQQPLIPQQPYSSGLPPAAQHRSLVSYPDPALPSPGPPRTTFEYPKSYGSQYSPSLTTNSQQSVGQYYQPPPQAWQPAPMPKPKPRIFVSIDYIHYGTENTSVAMAGFSRLQQIIGKSLLVLRKIVIGWGLDIANALSPTGYPKPGVQKVEWLHLYLVTQESVADSINLPPLPPGLDAADVSADYLYELRLAIRAALQRNLGDVFDQNEGSIHWIFTIPELWAQTDQTPLRRVIERAGYIGDEDDKRLSFISEAEASASNSMRHGLLTLDPNDAFIYVSCGKGVVDMSAYQVVRDAPLTLLKLTDGSMDSCGSTSLNRIFSNVLRTKIRAMKLPDGSKTAGRVYAKAIMDFENRIKTDFRNNGQKWAVDVGIEADFLEANIEDGYMVFTNNEIISCFEPVIDRILEMLRHQIDEVWKTGRILQVLQAVAFQDQTNIRQRILVGGEFGSSEYLVEEIKSGIPGDMRTKVIRAGDPTSDVVMGGVNLGLSRFLAGDYSYS